MIEKQPPHKDEMGGFWEPFSIKTDEKIDAEKYAKMKPKGSPRGRKWSQNGSQNHEKIDPKIHAENGSKKH